MFGFNSLIVSSEMIVKLCLIVCLGERRSALHFQDFFLVDMYTGRTIV